MTEKRPILLFSSAIALTLALHQSALAEAIAEAPPSPEAQPLTAPPAPSAPPAAKAESTGAPSSEGTAQSQPASTEVAPSSAPAPVAPSAAVPPVDTEATQSRERVPAEPATGAPQPPSPPERMDDARARMKERRADMMEQRNRRYEELRERAAEVGLELPDTPPWEQPGPKSPDMTAPAISGGTWRALSPEERDAMRAQRFQSMRERAMQSGIELPEVPPWMLMSDEEREAHREKMRTMSPEERRAMRDEHWQEMRDRAAERGIEMPETPPWKQAEQRREDMRARWESYKETLNTLTPEQKEAVEALFGPAESRFSPPTAGPRMPPRMPMQPPFGQQRGFGVPFSHGSPGYDARGTGPSPFDMTTPPPWHDGGQPMYPRLAPSWPDESGSWSQGPPPPGTN